MLFTPVGLYPIVIIMYGLNKMLQVFKEVTEWDDPSLNEKNGTYWVNSAGNLVAFEPPGGPRKVFKNPLKGFSKSYRKFQKLGTIDEEHPTDSITVKGSNGETYVISDGVCSCPGFKYRGKCKHVSEKTG